MKKIINGKVYDTETAKELARWDNGLSYNDFGSVEETLYRKKTGEFFLHGCGGANTQYAEPSGTNWWKSGERIMPLCFAEAREWAEKHLSGEVYEEIFGAVTEDESRQRVTLSLSSHTVETLKRRASEAGITVSAYIDHLVK